MNKLHKTSNIVGSLNARCFLAFRRIKRAVFIILKASRRFYYKKVILESKRIIKKLRKKFIFVHRLTVRFLGKHSYSFKFIQIKEVLYFITTKIKKTFRQKWKDIRRRTNPVNRQATYFDRKMKQKAVFL